MHVTMEAGVKNAHSSGKGFILNYSVLSSVMALNIPYIFPVYTQALSKCITTLYQENTNVQVTSGIFYGIARDSIPQLFYTMPKKILVQWLTQSCKMHTAHNRRVECNAVECTLAFL